MYSTLFSINKDVAFSRLKNYKVLLSLVFTSDASTKRKTALVDARMSTSTRINFFFLFLVLAFALQQVKTKYRTRISTRRFITRGFVWPMKTLDPDYLAPKRCSKMAEGSDDFACACVCVEFRFHFGHP